MRAPGVRSTERRSHQTANDAVITADVTGAIAGWNPAAERMFGYTKAEVIGQSLTLLLPQRYRDGHLAGISRVQAGGERRVIGKTIELHGLTKTGDEFPLELSLSEWATADGKFFTAIIRDITERKRMERELRHKTELAQLLQQLARTADEAVSPEAAMGICLKQICEQGNWALGRVATFGAVEPRFRPKRSQWFCPEPARFDTFMRFTDGQEFVLAGSKLIGVAFGEQRPIWLPDLTVIERKKSGRIAKMIEAGLKAGFAFPVIVRGEVVAILEFLATEMREPDVLLMEGTAGLASQFARMIERGRADETRAKLAAIVENANDAIISRALDRTITSWNAAAERILGYTAAEAIGRELAEIIPPEERHKMAANRERIRAGQPILDHETVRIAKNGRRIDVTLSASGIHDHGGNVVGYAAIIRDITRRKQAERELLHKTELAQLLEQLARAANEAVSPEAAMEICLKRICEQGKWALSRVASFETVDSRFRPDRSQWFVSEPARFDTFMRFTDAHEFVLAGSKFVGAAFREQRPVWLADFTVIDRLKSGRIAKAIEAGFKAGFAFPVIVRGKVAAILEFLATETREPDPLLIEGSIGLASQFARMIERGGADETRARLAAIVESSNDAIVSRALDNTVTSWNAAAERVFGYSAAEVIGRDLVEIFPPEVRQQIDVLRERTKSGKPLLNYEAVRITKDGRRINVTLNSFPILDSSGKNVGYGGIVRDMTEYKQAQEALQTANARLRDLTTHMQSAIESERARIARDVHDSLGGALTAMRMDISWCIKQLKPGQVEHDILDRMQVIVDRAGDAMQEVRRIITDLRPSILDHLGLWEALEWLAEDFAERSGTVCQVMHPGTRRVGVSTDRATAVFRIVQEALTNVARHACATHVMIEINNECDDLVVKVIDNGKGVMPERLAAPDTYGILGMRERATSFGGSVKVARAPAAGTSVELRLPLAAAPLTE